MFIKHVSSSLARGADKKGTGDGIVVHSRKLLSSIGYLLFCILAGVAASWNRSAQADVYKCRTGTGFLYTDDRVADSCRRIQLEVSKPDPEAIARLEKWKAQRIAEAAREAAEAREERLVRVRELEALAAWQSARAAMIDAQAAQYCRYPQPVYFPVWSYPIAGPIFRDYSSFNGYSFPYGIRSSRYQRYGMPPVQRRFSRKWR